MQPPEGPRRKAHADSGASRSQDYPDSPHQSLLAVLINPASTEHDIKATIKQRFNPKTFNDAKIEFGFPDLKVEIQCVKALKLILKHISTNGNCFPNIRFVGCHFNKACFETLLLYLPECTRLQSLAFDNCSLQSDDLSSLVAALLFLKDNLQELAITNNPIPALADLKIIFGLFLQKSTALSVLNLSRTELNETHALELATALTDNNSIHTLILDNNNINFSGALDLVSWLKGYPKIRRCSLVGNGLTLEKIVDLERLLGRSPSPFVFESKIPTPPPPKLSAPAPKSEQLADLKEMISSADGYTTLLGEMISKLSDQEKQEIFIPWLKLGFNIKEIDLSPGEKTYLSLFKAINKACDKDKWGSHATLFEATLDYIIKNIDDFTASIFEAYPLIPEGVYLGDYFQQMISERAFFPTEIFYTAVQAVLKKHNVLRPIYIYSQPMPLESAPNGKLVLPPTQRLETNENKNAEPIGLYLGQFDRYALLEKKRKP